MEADVYNEDTQTDRQTDMTNFIADFRNFLKVTEVRFPVLEF